MSLPTGYERYNTETVVAEDKTSFIGWFVFVCFLLIVIIVLTYLYFNQKSKLINPNKCPRVMGEYGVKPNRTGTTLRVCGITGNKPCRSTELSLADAIKTCTRRSDICTTFSYNSNIGTMEILDPNLPLVNAIGVDVYERQIEFIEDTNAP